METAGHNHVTRTGGEVIKVHFGPDGAERAVRAAAALGHAGAFGLPVPAVVALDGPRLVTVEMPAATDGAGLLETAPAVVLRALGAFARDLHHLPPPSDWTQSSDWPPPETPLPETWLPEAPLPEAPLHDTLSATFVHGDLCPVNLLFDADEQLVGVVDWEDSHIGDPLVDLAWSEWLVRTWHQAAIGALPDLYAAHGEPVPDADRRRGVMAVCLRHHGARATDSDERAAWDRRLAALPALDLRL